MPIDETQQTVKQHAVPQNIMQVEFKVIGDLTMRQFFYLVLGAVFAFVIYKSTLPGIIRLPVSLVIGLGGIAIAFVPINDRGMDIWITNFFRAIYQPTLRIWRREESIPVYFLYQSAQLLKSEMLAIAPTASRRKLEKYLERESPEKPIDDVDARENAYIQKVREAFQTFPSLTPEIQTYNAITQSVVEAPTEILGHGAIPTPLGTDITPPIPVKPYVPETTKRGVGQPNQVKEQVEEKKAPIFEPQQTPIPKPVEPAFRAPKATPPPQLQPSVGIAPAKDLTIKPIPIGEAPLEWKPKIPTPLQPFAPTQTQPPAKFEAKQQTVVEKTPPPEPKQSQEQKTSVVPQHISPKIEVGRVNPVTMEKESQFEGQPKTSSQIRIVHQPAKPATEVTPDRLSGRRFTGLSSTQGEIILPIRGERIMKTTAEEHGEVGQDLNKKAEELKVIVDKIKFEEQKNKQSQARVIPQPTQQPTPKPLLQPKPQITSTEPKPQQVVEAKKETPAPTQTPPTPPQLRPENLVHMEEVTKVKTENERLEKEIQTLRQSLNQTSKTAVEKEAISQQITKLLEEKKQTDTQVASLTQKVREMEEKLKESQKIIEAQASRQTTTQANTPQFDATGSRQTFSPGMNIPSPRGPTTAPVKAPLPTGTPAEKSFVKSSPLTNIPNIINGVVKDSEMKLIESAVIIIKDAKGDTVRALKTNGIGQFTITTPVTNGSYIVEVSKEGKGIKFENVSLDVKGEVLPPIEFIGKL